LLTVGFGIHLATAWMSNSATSLQFASVASALVWPLAAGVAVVLWSKHRAVKRARDIAALEGQLQGFYRSLESHPVSPQLAMVVDALAEGDELAGSAKGRSGKTPAGS